MKTVQPHDLITREDLRELASIERDPCATLYLPTHPSPPESLQDHVRLRNVLDEAEEQLLKRDMRRPQIEHLLEPARAAVADDSFWMHRSEGLAAFLADDFNRLFRLPVRFEEQLTLERQFLITPLISLLQPGRTFFILALSQNSCRLFRGTQFQVEPVENEDLPHDLQSALGWEYERQLNYHAFGGGGTETAIFHGQAEDDKKIDVTAYLRQVAAAIEPMLHNQAAPLIFAGVKELFPIFSELCDYDGLVPEVLHGNPDLLTPRQLHQQAWLLVKQFSQRQADAVWDTYYQRRNEERATNDLAVILPACRDGLADTLLLGEGLRQPGQFEGHSTQAVDLLNLAAVFALRTGGNVLTVSPDSIPDKRSAAAWLRAPVSAISTNNF